MPKDDWRDVHRCHTAVTPFHLTRCDGYNDCLADKAPSYYSGRTAAGDAYLQGWQDANAELIRRRFAEGEGA